MRLPTRFIDYQGNRLHYTQAGKGPIPLLLFHGFGQDHRAFEEWVQPLGTHYTFYAFDIFFHGQSQWPSREPLEKSDWQSIMAEFLAAEKIGSFAIAGFSLGGKFALATVEAFPEKVKKLILLAPDGIKTSSWYSLATYPSAIRSVFKSMVLHPDRFYTMARFLRGIGLVDKGLMRFAESQMDTEEKRRRVYYSWVYFRHLKFSISGIAHLLNHHRIPVQMIVGRYDKVIPAGNMNRLLHLLELKQMDVVEAGHNDLIKKSIPFLAAAKELS